MTLADLDRIAAELERLRAEWALHCLTILDRKLDDAVAHARNAVTATLKNLEDGRPTVRKARNSRSFAAAVSRLSELLTALTGASAVSLGGEIRQLREAAYRLAFDLHRPFVPPEFLVKADPRPTTLALRLVRAAALHGMDPRQELELPIRAAIDQLGAAVAQAGARDGDQRTTDLIFDAWKLRTRKKLEQTILHLLSDSVEHAHNEAMADLIHPDHRADPAAATEE